MKRKKIFKKLKKLKKINLNYLLPILTFMTLIYTGYYMFDDIFHFTKKEIVISYDIGDIPKYNGNNHIIINDNIPNFTNISNTNEEFQKFSDLDNLGRSGPAIANIGYDMMPTTERGSIGGIRPTGWHTIKYDSVYGKYLYNRCHLIGYQLTGENANSKNLITCTRQMNTIGMLPFENKIAEYIKRTKHHVLYRVTPIFENNNLLATGVQMEAKSIEDNEISFNVFVYNVQDGIEINYKNGNSKIESN